MVDLLTSLYGRVEIWVEAGKVQALGSVEKSPCLHIRHFIVIKKSSNESLIVKRCTTYPHSIDYATTSEISLHKSIAKCPACPSSLLPSTYLGHFGIPKG
jgi:hypothetical protein